MPYLLDADVFIRAKNDHYGMDFCPAFWQWLVAGNAAGSVFSVQRVRDELLAGSDELSRWAEGLGTEFFLRPDEQTIPALATVSRWATSRDYEPAAVNSFLHAADYYLVAQACAGQHTVVTHEIPSASKRRIKIPDACLGLQLRFLTPYQMLRREHARFVLGQMP